MLNLLLGVAAIVSPPVILMRSQPGSVPAPASTSLISQTYPPPPFHVSDPVFCVPGLDPGEIVPLTDRLPAMLPEPLSAAPAAIVIGPVPAPLPDVFATF